MVDRQGHAAGGGNGSGRSWRLYLAVVLGIIALIFVIQNSQEVEVDFILATTTTPLFFVLVVSIALGALIGWLLPRMRGSRRSSRED